MRLLAIGCGYSARALAPRLLAKGWEVRGTTRREDSADSLRALGITPIIWPGDDLAPHIGWASHVLHSVSPDDGDPVLDAYGAALAAADLDGDTREARIRLALPIAEGALREVLGDHVSQRIGIAFQTDFRPCGKVR